MIFAPLGAIQSIVTTVGGILSSQGRTDWLLYWGILSGVFIVISFVIGLRGGILGVAAAYAAVNLILICILLSRFPLSYRLRLSSLVKVLWRPIVCSLVMLAVLLVLEFVLPLSLSQASVLVILIMSGLLVTRSRYGFLIETILFMLWVLQEQEHRNAV